MTKEELFKKFDQDLKLCLSLVKEEKDEEAKEFFNNNILMFYSEHIYGEGELNEFLFILNDLKEYFNNENAKILGLYTTDREYILMIDKEDEYIKLMTLNENKKS